MKRPLLLCLLALAPMARGSDSCTTPTPLSGLGPFAFDTTAATTGAEGQGEALCCTFAACGFASDVWFTWVAPRTGVARMSTRGGTSLDTKIAAYAGTSCPSGPALACNDDFTTLQADIFFDVVAGATYTLQLGASPTSPTTTGTGTFTLGVEAGQPFCAGDGSGTSCPCANVGWYAHGCSHSQGTGARLVALGQASVSQDTLTLEGTEMPANASALYFQGTQAAGTGTGVPFGDGLLCVGGARIRLGVRVCVLGASRYGASDGTGASVSVRGQIPPAGGMRTYQVWFRDTAAFCTGATFNLSNGLQITWGA